MKKWILRNVLSVLKLLWTRTGIESQFVFFLTTYGALPNLYNNNNNKSVRVEVSMRLGCSICVAHTCKCGASVDTYGHHALICKKAPSKIVRHNAINDIFARVIRSAGIPVCKEPTGLARTDCKRPDVLMLLPWESSKPLTLWYHSGKRTCPVIHTCLKSYGGRRCRTRRFVERGQVLVPHRAISFSQ